MTVRLYAAALTIAVTAATAAAADELSGLLDVGILPAGTVRVSGVVPRMGEHWANPKDLPLGPIYCVHKGKIVCIEYMVSQADLKAGKSWPELAGLKNLPSINHVNMGFEPKGHEGYEVPHYDMHIYFVSPEILKSIKPAQKSARAR